MEMECPRCHNKNVRQLYPLDGQYYCRKCIQFQRVMIDEKRTTSLHHYPAHHVDFQLDFELSAAQQKISHQLILHYQNHINSLVLAVCGSGKTEIVYELIQYVLSLGKRVCFCVPRKELVIELYDRLKHAFYKETIGILYGGCQKHQDAQMIVCTMHQLYRFENHIGFDLMIADEVDAFPFYQNQVLNEIFQRCCLGNYVKMSATFTLDDVQDEQLLIMNRRYHNYDLPLPKMILCPTVFQKYVLLHIVQHSSNHFLVFVPTVHMVDELVTFLQQKHITSLGVSSSHQDNQAHILHLKKGHIQVLVTTTLLERGITIEDIQVIVYQCQHSLFDQRTLIQIAGRVGRKPDYPTGHVYFLTNERTKGISQCIKTIQKLNTMNV